jgi:hypothetical protein
VNDDASDFLNVAFVADVSSLVETAEAVAPVILQFDMISVLCLSV